MSAARRSAARPPRRFAPPLLIRGGEIRVGLPPPRFAPPLLDEEGKATTPPFPPLLILRRGAREAGGVVQALSLWRAKLRRHPVGGLVAVAVPEVVDDVVAAFDHREHAGARDRRSELLALSVRGEAVLGARDDVDRAGDVLRALGEREAQRDLARFLEVRALRAHAEGF